jgi:hypothetical protein
MKKQLYRIKYKRFEWKKSKLHSLITINKKQIKYYEHRIRQNSRRPKRQLTHVKNHWKLPRRNPKTKGTQSSAIKLNLKPPQIQWKASQHYWNRNGQQSQR